MIYDPQGSRCSLVHGPRLTRRGERVGEKVMEVIRKYLPHVNWLMDFAGRKRTDLELLRDKSDMASLQG